MRIRSQRRRLVVVASAFAGASIAGCSLLVDTSGLAGAGDAGTDATRGDAEASTPGIDAATDAGADGDASGVQDTGPDGAKPAPAFVQGVGNVTNTSQSLTLAMAPTQANDLMVIGVSEGFGSTTPVATVTDNATGGSNTYVSANVRSVETGDSNAAEIWYAKALRPGATAVTITLTAPLQQLNGWAMEFSGLSLTNPLDTGAIANNQSSASTVAAPKVVPSGPEEIVVSVVVVIGIVQGIAPGNPFIALPIESGDDAAYYVAHTPGAYGGTWNIPGSMTWCGSTAAFR